MTVQKASLVKRFFATFLDLLTAFFAFGLAIAHATGMLTPTGFELHGKAALLLFAMIAGYFAIGRLVAGGTLWDRIFRIPRPQSRAS